MKTKRVKELMVPLSEYATASQDATLSEAVSALKKAQADFDQTKYRHRAILVYDQNKKIVGKVNLQAVLKGLEPKYDDMLSDEGPSHLGFTRSFQKKIIDHFKLWQDPLDRLCEKAAKVKISSFMAAPKPEEMISAETTLDEAINRLLLSNRQSLLVTEDYNVVGVLRLTDVYEVVAEAILACEI